MIFVSHAWINGKPDERVLKLVAKLRESGFEACCDVMFAGDRTSIHFKQMMAENMQKSEKIIVALSEEYKRKADLFEGGVGVEYKYILEDIDINTRKYILVSLKTDLSEIEIPDALRGREIICLGKDFDKLFYKLEDIREYQFPEVNPRKKIVTSKKVYGSQDYANISENGVLLVKSRTQEYADKWNENMFLNNFSEWDENAGVNVKLKEVYIDEHLPHFIWGNNVKESDNLDILLSKYIGEKNEDKMLLILGLPGIGKSTLITWITVYFMDRIDDILVYKFASDLNDIDWQSDKIFGEILKKLELSYDDLNGKTLILDGFDEISVGDNRKDILDNLHFELLFRKNIVNFSLIITCRENYIQRIKSINCDYITLQPWNEVQIMSFCKIFQDITENKISEYTTAEAITNRNVFGIPLILYIVLSLNISIKENGSIADVYDKIFSLEGGIYDRCIANKSFADKHRISRIKMQIHQISREIALWMFENKPDEANIPQEEYQKICADEKNKNEYEKVEQDFLIGSYFKLVKHCEGMETEKICFVHRSIYEYFVAEYIFTSMQKPISNEELAGILGLLLKGNVLSKDKEIIVFLMHFVKKCSFQYLFEHIKKTFDLMLSEGMTYYTNRSFICVTRCESIVFANMMEIMHLWDVKKIEFNNSICDYIKSNTGIILNLREINLEGKDLEYANLSGANLSGANLNSVNLRSANLKGANLRLAKLNSSNLKGVNLVRAELMGAKFIGADLERANLKGADLSGAKLLSANLSGADLRNAQLKMTKLAGANLSRADLRKAYLSRLKLDDVKLTGANISGILWEGINKEALYSTTRLLLEDEDNEYEKMGLRQNITPDSIVKLFSLLKMDAANINFDDLLYMIHQFTTF